MKKTFLLCSLALVSSSVFAINLKCTSDNDAVADREIKFISDQRVNFCPDRIGLGSIEEKGMTVASLVYVKQEGRLPSSCRYRDFTGNDTTCIFVPQN